MKVLIIEDEHRLAQSIKKGLSQENIISEIAENGQDGLDMALSGEYNVILLDLMLPVIDGWQVCKSLREAKTTTPILMLTARGEVKDKVDGLNLGADDYLAKPFDFDELLARIHALSRRPQKTIAPTIKFDDIEIDTINSEVFLKGKSLLLTKKEFLLFEYLVLNKNKTLSKDQIIDNVWDFEKDILPNTVEVYMGYLRKKIGSKYFKTIRGFGYKFVT